MRRVIIESPFAAPTPEGVAANVAYAIECMRDSLGRGEAPYASHLLFTQCLDDKDPAQRRQGIAAGLEWGKAAAASVVYTDLGISQGMKLGIEAANAAGRRIEYRKIRVQNPKPPSETD